MLLAMGWLILEQINLEHPFKWLFCILALIYCVVMSTYYYHKGL